jgi:D-glycero-alpha-D-manno-heptose-7-phosphate kinase
LDFSDSYKSYLESNLLIGFSGRSRFSSLKATKIVEIISKNEKEELLRHLMQLSEKGIEAMIIEKDVNFHAKLTKKIRDIKMELNGDINDSFLQNIIAKTESAGSLCTRFLGAGGGGFFLCWAPKNSHNQIKESVSMKTWLDVKFSFDGCTVLSSEYPEHVI